MPVTTADPEARTEAQRRRDEALVIAALALLGGSLGWTRRDLKAIAVVGPGDVEAARRNWADATGADLLSGETWRPDVQTYAGAGGPLTPQAMKSLSLRYQAAVSGRVQAATQQLIDQQTTIGDWQRTVGRAIRRMYIALAAFAVGGIFRLLPRDTSDLSASMQFTFGRLERFARQAEHGDAAATSSPGLMLSRVSLYAASGSKIYENGRRVSHLRDRVATLERNVLAVADHCLPGERPGCPEETKRGLVPIGTLSLPGERTCLANCKCTLMFARG